MAQQIEDKDAIYLSDEASSKIKQLNLDYLLLLRQMAIESPAAVMALGLSQELIDIITEIEHSKLVQIANCEIPLCRLRFNQVDFWRTIKEENRYLNNELFTYYLLKEPVEL